MWCSDQSIQYLKGLGYCVVRLPKADVKPLQVLEKQRGVFEGLDDLDKILKAGDNVPLPRVSGNSPAPNISGHQTSQHKIGMGISLMSIGTERANPSQCRMA